MALITEDLDELKMLLEGAFNIVEMWEPNWCEQKEWKQNWLNRVAELLDIRGE